MTPPPVGTEGCAGDVVRSVTLCVTMETETEAPPPPTGAAARGGLVCLTRECRRVTECMCSLCQT